LQPFASCTGQQEKSSGWIPVRGEENGALLESVNGQWMAKYQIETRRVPNEEVEKHMNARVQVIEHNEGRKPGKKELRELRQEVREMLMPSAFASQAAVNVWVDRAKGRLVLDSTVSSKTNEVITALVRAWDGFAPVPMNTEVAPQAAMTEWLSQGQEPQEFFMGKGCELRAQDESKAVVRYSHHNLLNEEVRMHIVQGKWPTRLELNWGDRVVLTLTDKWQLRNVVLQNGEQEKAGEPSQEVQDEKAVFSKADKVKAVTRLDWDAQVFWETTEIGGAIDALIQTLGGTSQGMESASGVLPVEPGQEEGEDAPLRRMELEKDESGVGGRGV
jgi:recombination associated protein RdgC